MGIHSNTTTPIISAKIIDEDALVKALDARIVAQAALDVFTVEPSAKDSKLVLHEKVIATLHLGASTMEAQIAIAEAVVGAIRGELATTAVNAQMVPAELWFILLKFHAYDKGLPLSSLLQGDATGELTVPKPTPAASSTMQYQLRCFSQTEAGGLP
ncbi:hypothetical protein FNV43_RR22555 [Rhamnella rubrinervis]|uniref:D-isomer specific 2-hydroxyacid dehydrogenase NAD-binding domain-containing protein n=1 Tax=Rhamnella rubrinervis TaxID=2594499 RepID=A0A8K0DVF7_9ROSA|nr:hypothetical protein FNV43_RR22555 [Rhamnella rubrinervis]